MTLFSCSALTQTERQAQLCREYDRPRSQLAVEVCLCPERHLCCIKLSVSYPLDKTTIYVYSLLFCQHTQDSCKDETDFPHIQMPFEVHTVSDREL